jgi:hypothetical protein
MDLTYGRLHVTFIDKEGEEHTFEVAKGDNLLDIALENDIEMEGMDAGPNDFTRLILRQVHVEVHAPVQHVMS